MGGTRGGGKSHCVIGRQILGAMTYATHWNGLIVRQKYKDLANMRRDFDEIIRDKNLPAERVGGDNQTNYIRFKNGASITMAAIGALRQADDYQGQQYTLICIDEAPTIPYIGQLIDRLKGCLRSPHGVPCQMFLTGNPGGAGASQIRKMFIDPVPEGTVNHIVTDLGKDKDGNPRSFTTSRVFIKSTYQDNKILMEKDPNYEHLLASISDERLRKAWMEGNWDQPVGQAFIFDPFYHVIDPIWPIPEYAPIYMTYDWGWGAPFSIGWWWADSDNRIYRFAEWYGWDGRTPNVGLRLVDEDVARGIIQREEELGITDRQITRLAGHDCWNKKPDYRGGGQGPSTATVFLSQFDLKLRKADPNRELKIRQFRSRLAIPDQFPDVLPMLVSYSTCHHFNTIIPDLVVDEATGEYLEDGQELHPFDDAAQICMARPVGMSREDISANKQKEARKALLSRLDPESRAALADYKEQVDKAVNLPDDAPDTFFGIPI